MGKIGRIDELLKMFLDLEAFFDATLKEILRPKDKQKRKDFYYGKKKKHCIKPHTTNNKNMLIIHISRGVGGKNTITPYLKSSPCPFLKLERNHDYGHQGIKKDFPELKVRIPYKNRKDMNS